MYMFEVHSHPSYGTYPNKGKTFDENFMGSKAIVPRKSITNLPHIWYLTV